MKSRQPAALGILIVLLGSGPAQAFSIRQLWHRITGQAKPAATAPAAIHSSVPTAASKLIKAPEPPKASEPIKPPEAIKASQPFKVAEPIAPAVSAPAISAPSAPSPAAKFSNISKPQKGLIKSTIKELTEELYGPRYAANMVLIPHRDIDANETLLREMGEYGSHEFKRVSVTGLGASGEYRADFVGTVSAHDMRKLDKATFADQIQKRAASDGIRITLQHSGRTEVLVANHPSDLITHLPLTFRLKPGVNRITYYRTNRLTGSIVSVEGGYDEGRVLEIEWDGK